MLARLFALIVMIGFGYQELVPPIFSFPSADVLLPISKAQFPLSPSTPLFYTAEIEGVALFPPSAPLFFWRRPKQLFQLIFFPNNIPISFFFDFVQVP